MSSNDVTESDLFSWIATSVENEFFADYEIKLQGKTEKGDGFVGEVIFANVIGTTKENNKKELNLVVKYGKSNDHLRKIVPIRDVFKTEIHFYTQIVPEFTKLQKEREVREMFDAVPKCYKTIILDSMEVLVLNNLKSLGYELYDKKKPLNLEHQKKVLTEYGKLHALSFALQDQKPEVFSAVTNRPNLIAEFYKDESTKKSIENALDDAIAILEARKEFSLVEKMKKTVNRSTADMQIDLMYQEIPDGVVITHGDCWNNNFMYKYEDDNRTTPSKVKILDWQISSLRSPVFDLSHFIYCASSKQELDKFTELLEVYYTSFSNFLRKLGSDPEKLYPYSTLKSHWRKYSIYGVLFLPAMLKFILCDKEDAPEMADLKEGQDFGSFLDIEIKDQDTYYERLSAVLKHYFYFEF